MGKYAWFKSFWLVLLFGGTHVGLSGQAAIPDSLYLALVDSTLADLGKMDAVHTVLGYLAHSEKQVYNHAEGIQIRVKAQHNARKLPADDYYTILELMFELHPADDHGHAEADGPLMSYAEREMGVDAGWNLGRLQADIQVAGKGNEYLVKRMMEAVEKRFEGFREAHGLPVPYNAEEKLPKKEVETSRYLLTGLQGVKSGGKSADRKEMAMKVHADYWERRLGMVWSGEGGSQRFTVEMTMRDEQPADEDKGSLTEASAFRFQVLRRKHIYLRMNLATDPGSVLGQELDRVVKYYLPDFQ